MTAGKFNPQILKVEIFAVWSMIKLVKRWNNINYKGAKYMKKITCQDIDGICDTVIEGNNFQEILANRLWHLNQAAVIYPEHKNVLQKIQYMSDAEKDRWEEELLAKWNALPD